MVGGHHAALLHGVVEHGQSRRGAVGAADLQAHLLQNPRHAVSHRGGGGQAQIHNAEGHPQAAGGLLAHKLAHPGHLEGGFLDGLCHHVKGLALDALKGMVHHSRAGDAHIQHALGLAHPVEGAGHKGVVLHGVGKHHQLGTAQAVVVCGQLGSPLDHPAHLRHGVHVNTGPGGAHIDTGADPLRGGHGLGDGADELPVPRRGPLLDQSCEAADEVDAAGLGGGVHGFRQLHIGIRLAGGGDDGNGSHGNALVDDGDAEFPLDILPHLHQILGAAGDFLINFPAADRKIRVAAVQQADAHGDGPDVQVPLFDHILGGQDVLLTQHGTSLKCGAWLRRCPPAGRG